MGNPIFAFFVRAVERNVALMLDTSTDEKWKSSIRNSLNHPDAEVHLIKEGQWQAPPIQNVDHDPRELFGPIRGYLNGQHSINLDEGNWEKVHKGDLKSSLTGLLVILIKPGIDIEDGTDSLILDCRLIIGKSIDELKATLPKPVSKDDAEAWYADKKKPEKVVKRSYKMEKYEVVIHFNGHGIAYILSVYDLYDGHYGLGDWKKILPRVGLEFKGEPDTAGYLDRVWNNINDYHIEIRKDSLSRPGIRVTISSNEHMVKGDLYY